MFVWNVFSRTPPFADHPVCEIPDLIKTHTRPDVSLVLVEWMREVVTNCWRHESHKRWSFATVLRYLLQHVTEADIL
eukprot:m.4749 g.4749  ORF g.4749 m.4749 type:complete len:77 (+) comp5154_c0_seq1:3-233(+)